MERRLAEAFARAEEKRRELVGVVKGLGGAQREFRPGKGSWSALDVVQHLVLTDEAFLAQGRKHRADPPEAVTLKAKLLSSAVGFLMVSRLRVKAPTPVVLPKEVVPLEVLCQRWDAAYAGLAELLEGVPAGRLDVPLFRHPVSGRLDPARGISFLAAHAAHHGFQVERIRSSPGFPAA